MQHHDPKTIICDSLGNFIKELQDKGLKVSILTWRAEWAPMTAVPGENHGDVVFGSLREITLLAYHGSTGSIIHHDVRGEEADRVKVRAALEAAGITVEERSRNIT